MFNVSAPDEFQAIRKISNALVARGMSEPLTIIASRKGRPYFSEVDYLVTACGEYAIVGTVWVPPGPADLGGGGYAIAKLQQSDWKPTLAATGWGIWPNTVDVVDTSIRPIVHKAWQ